MAERKATAKWEGSIGEGAGKMALAGVGEINLAATLAS